jgi:hypothetical protein
MRTIKFIPEGLYAGNAWYTFPELSMTPQAGFTVYIVASQDMAISNQLSGILINDAGILTTKQTESQEIYINIDMANNRYMFVYPPWYTNTPVWVIGFMTDAQYQTPGSQKLAVQLIHRLTTSVFREARTWPFGEFIFDETTKGVYINDGITAGGIKLASIPDVDKKILEYNITISEQLSQLVTTINQTIENSVNGLSYKIVTSGDINELFEVNIIYFIDKEIQNMPLITSNYGYFLSTIYQYENNIIQSFKSVEGISFNRYSIDKGLSWSEWKRDNMYDMKLINNSLYITSR